MTSCGFNDLMLHGLWSFSYWLHLGKSLNTLGHWYFWQLDWDQQVLFSSQMKEDVTKSLHNEKSVFFIEHQRAVFQSTNVASKRQWDHVQLWNKHTFGTPKIHQSIQISLPSVGAADATKILKTTCVGPCPLFWFVKNLEVRVSQMYFFSSSNHQMQKGNLSLGYEFCWCRKTWGRTLLESVDYFLKVDQQNRDIELGCSSWWGFSSAGRVEVSRDPWFFEDQKSTSTFQCNHIPSFFWNWIFVWASNRLESCYECEQLKWFAACGLASRFQLRHDLERLYCGYRCLGVVVCWSGSRFGGLYPIFICIWKV